MNLSGRQGYQKIISKLQIFTITTKIGEILKKNVFLIFLREIQTKFLRKTYEKLMEECIKNTKFTLWPAVTRFEPSNL
jgi:hypothetical protein